MVRHYLDTLSLVILKTIFVLLFIPPPMRVLLSLKSTPLVVSFNVC